jgi:hypothetical protein
VRLPASTLAEIDQRAQRAGASRAQLIRDLLAQALAAVPTGDGVDRAQIQRMLRLTPAERVAHMVAVQRRMAALRGLATTR